MDTKDELKKARKIIQSRSHKLSNALNGEEYKNFIDLVSANWEGEEKDKFLNILEESTNTCREEIKFNCNNVQSLLDSKIK